MDGWGFLEQGAELARRGESFALATVVWRQGPSSGKESCRAIITATGELHGWIGGACAEPVVIRQAREVISEGVPRLLLLGTADQFGGPLPEGMNFVPISCQSEGSLEVYIEPIQPAPHLVVVGHSPMASTLAELSRALGWRTDLIAGQDFTAAAATQRSIVVVATQGHHDEEAVTEAIAARPAYVGLVGSARRGAAVLGYLAERGLPAGELDKVHVPAGLDLGPTTHREIAVAILAELVKLRASGALAAAAAGPAGDSGARVPESRRTCRRPPETPGPPHRRRPPHGPEAPHHPGPPRRPPPLGRRGPGVRDDRHRRAQRVPVRARGGHLLLLLRRLPPRVRERPGFLPQERDPMLITNEFEVAAPIDKVWRFFDDIPHVAACLPGTELTDDLGGDKYQGRVSIRMGPVRLRFTGTADIAERDEAGKRIVVNAAGADERGRGQAAMTVTATLARSRTGTKVGVAQDLQISGAAAQYGRGMISDVTSVLMRDFAVNLQDGIARLDRGESLEASAPAAREASGLAVGLQAAMMALRRVFRRFFLPYQAPNPS